MAGRNLDHVRMAEGEQAITGSNVVYAESVTASASDLTSVASGDFPYASFLYVGSSGDATITMVDGDSVSFTGLAGGVWHPMPAYTKLTAATATGLVAGY